jgi:hypothetical protein
MEYFAGLDVAMKETAICVKRAPESPSARTLETDLAREITRLERDIAQGEPRH